MTNPKKLKLLFDKLKSENAQSGIGYFPNGKSFVGRIVTNSEDYMTLIGCRGKQIKIYSFKKVFTVI
jgi:hypothetical protein